MGLMLNSPGTDPEGLYFSFRDISGMAVVGIGNYEISLYDFFAMVERVLMGPDLMGPGDPRIIMLERLTRLTEVESLNKGGKKLGLSEEPLTEERIRYYQRRHKELDQINQEILGAMKPLQQPGLIDEWSRKNYLRRFEEQLRVVNEWIKEISDILYYNNESGRR